LRDSLRSFDSVDYGRGRQRFPASSAGWQRPRDQRCCSTFTSELSSQPVLSRSRQPIRFWDSLGRPFAEADVTVGAWPVGQLQHGLKLVCRPSGHSDEERHCANEHDPPSTFRPIQGDDCALRTCRIRCRLHANARRAPALQLSRLNHTELHAHNTNYIYFKAFLPIPKFILSHFGRWSEPLFSDSLLIGFEYADTFESELKPFLELRVHLIALNSLN
jgi:hypothetical protein